jgi:hypothetical protein
MSFKVHLEILRVPLVTDDPDDKSLMRGLTSYKDGPRLAELMLFDGSSLALVPDHVEEGWCNPLSERTSAVKRFHRRLPSVLTALDWHPLAREPLPRFGQFLADLDWPYIRLETVEVRALAGIDVDAFDRDLRLALHALDLPAIAEPGKLFGGPGRYSKVWERLLEFCFAPTDAIYEGDSSVLREWPWGAPAYSNDSSEELAERMFGGSYPDFRYGRLSV